MKAAIKHSFFQISIDLKDLFTSGMGPVSGLVVLGVFLNTEAEDVAFCSAGWLELCFLAGWLAQTDRVKHSDTVPEE